MKSIEVVSHCYSLEHPHFLECLKYQLASLLEEKAVHVTATICYCQEDRPVSHLLHWYTKNTKLHLHPICLSTEQLSRRAIGRNVAALGTRSGLVWFADADHVFLKGVLGRLCYMDWPREASMIYPRQIMITKDHETGDRMLKTANPLHARYINPELFIPKNYSRAIGGVQIVSGKFSRQYGYLSHDTDAQKWLTPTKDGKPFRSFRDDIAYRNFCKKHGKIMPVDLPGLYRIRHSTTTYQPPKRVDGCSSI